MCNTQTPTEDFYVGEPTTCKSCVKQKRREYYQKNKELVKSRVASYKATGRPRELRQANLSERRRKDREAARRNQHSRTAYMRRRRNTDPLFRLASQIRGRLSSAIRSMGFRKQSKTADVLGCSFEELTSHLEKQFTPGMGWHNYGRWCVDHIIPLASAATIDDLERLAHYTNLQPLWAADNLKKRNTTDRDYFYARRTH